MTAHKGSSFRAAVFVLCALSSHFLQFFVFYILFWCYPNVGTKCLAKMSGVEKMKLFRHLIYCHIGRIQKILGLVDPGVKLVLNGRHPQRLLEQSPQATLAGATELRNLFHRQVLISQ